MPDHDSTNSANENTYPDAEDWESVFEVYAEHPALAFSLAQYFNAVKQYLEGERKRIPDATEALDGAVDCLFHHTDFRRVSHELFRAALEGRITIEQEQSLRDLGVRI